MKRRKSNTEATPETGTRSKGLSRRQLLRAGTGAVAAASVGGTAEAWRTGAPFVRTRARHSLQVAYVPWHEPPVVSSSGGQLFYTFNVLGKEKETLSCTGNFFKDVLRSYNGLKVGATLKVKRGDEMIFKMINHLPPDVCNPDNFDNCCPTLSGAASPCCLTPFDHNQPHCFNTTNLHTHGLHVSPASYLNEKGELICSDEVLLEIKPGKSQRFCIRLPDFHAPGSYWYHAHKHGATAIALSSGNALCGALIVEDDVDEMIVPDDTPDRVWLIQEQLGDQASLVYSCLPGSFTSTFTVNGQFQPTLKMHPGQVERWRFINASATPRGFGEIQLLDPLGNPLEMHLVAVDGITFYGQSPQPKTTWQVAPGGRADFLVKIPPLSPVDGIYTVRKAMDPTVFVTVDQDLAYIVLSGPIYTDKIPDKLPQRPKRTCYLEPIFDAVLKPDIVDFGVAGGGCGGASCTPIPQVFTIQGQPFDPNVVNHNVPLGAVQEWQLANNAGSLHPFHIHVNPFQVVGEPVNPAGPDNPTNWMWRDTVSVPTSGVNIRSRFLTFDGKFVLHCHVLNHEDLGMMQIVQVGNTIYDPKTGARLAGDGVGPCQAVEKCKI
ncbi:MAG: multicopper oxidase domain-containing protein [Planctomycetota bacterium]